MRRAEAWLVAVLLAVFALGAALLPLQAPWFTRTLVVRVSEVEPGEAARLAEHARAFVTSGDDTDRAALESAMTADAVTHLDDVRLVLVAANRVVAALAALLAAWALLRGRRHPELAAATLGRAGALLAAGAAFAVAFALVDFDAFFSAFHGLFFAEGTWLFPSDSVLIRLFPEPFWTWAGAAWAALVAVFAFAYGAGAWALSARRAGDGAV